MPKCLEEQPRRRFLSRYKREGGVYRFLSLFFSLQEASPRIHDCASSQCRVQSSLTALDPQCLLCLAFDRLYTNIWTLSYIAPNICCASNGVLRSVIIGQPMSSSIGLTSGGGGATGGKETTGLVQAKLLSWGLSLSLIPHKVGDARWVILAPFPHTSIPSV